MRALTVLLQVRGTVEGLQQSSRSLPSPVVLANRRCHADMLMWMVAHYPSGLRERSGEGEVALHHASAKGVKESIIRVMIAAYPEGPLIGDNRGVTPMLEAATAGHGNIVRLLLEFDPSGPKRCDHMGGTPMTASVQHGDVETVRAMRDACQEAVELSQGRPSPLDLALTKKDEAMIRALLGR